ncbi:MAG: DegV family protein [Anaerolineae bacterium]|nr:DegV family protein [Anaerolineae bacterium]
MGRVRIVTDSTAQFLDPAIVERLGITVVPLSISLGTRVYREGVDIDSATFLRLAQQSDIPARLIAPSPEDFAAVFRRLNQETDQVLALLMSRRLSQTWENALRASKMLLGRCEIVPLDSMTLSVGLALLVEKAAQAAESGASLEEIVHQARSQLPHVYSVFYVNELTYLRHTGLLSEAQTILGTMLDIKPFLTIEEGELIPMEKVRTQAQAIDKMVEFVAEFSALEQLVILHSAPHPTERTRLLQEHLATEFPGCSFPLVMYQSSLAALIGPDGVGVVVYEDPNAEDSLS